MLATARQAKTRPSQGVLETMNEEYKVSIQKAPKGRS